MSSKPGVWFTLLPATRNLKMRFARYLATLNLRHEHPSKSTQQKPWAKFINPPLEKSNRILQKRLWRRYAAAQNLAAMHSGA